MQTETEIKRPSTEDKFSEAQELFAGQKFQETQEICQSILDKDGEHIGALNLLAGSFARTGQINKAIEILEKVCALKPDNASLQINLCRMYQFNKQFRLAISPCSKAIQAEPDNYEYRLRFSHLVQYFKFNEFSNSCKDSIRICLEDPNISHSNLFRIWKSHFFLDPQNSDLIELANSSSYEIFIDKIENYGIENIATSLCDPFLLNGLNRLLVRDNKFETLLTMLRRYILLNIDAEKTYTNLMPFIYAMAANCNLNEYIFDINEEENKALNSQIEKLENIKEITLQNKSLIGIIASYKSLYKIEGAHHISNLVNSSSEEAFQTLIKSQIDEPLEERKIIPTIPSLSPIKDDVSTKVLEQYEENPYPRWTHIEQPILDQNHIEASKGKEILVAGCGTGKEAINISLCFPNAKITAIDLSKPSIAYGIRKVKELGMNNIEFMQADILEIEKLDKKFDLIISSGVLHHMEDPILGWSKLMTRLKPDGVIKLALYSEIARRTIVKCREWIKDQGYPVTDEGIRKFRQDMFALEEDNPLSDIATHGDFYSMSNCRDLVFHVQESRYSWPKIGAIHEDFDLDILFINLWNPNYKIEYLQMFPDDPNILNLDYLDKFEQQYTQTFYSMYNFWSKRKDAEDAKKLPYWLTLVAK